MKTNANIPLKGFQGLKQNWKTDMSSGFMIFLLALPLSLGIAKASGFPPAMGVLTAMIGGLFTSLFKASELTIKGPAAGLITICAAACAEFGGDGGVIYDAVTGMQVAQNFHAWQMVCGVIVVASVLQILFGVLKFGSLSDFFPHSAIHGMLAAIGLIIIAKQIPVLLGDDPSIYKGESVMELFRDIPKFVMESHWHIAVIGLTGLCILFLLPLLKIGFIKKMPLPLFVLILTVPLAIIWNFKSTEGTYALVKIGNFWGEIRINAIFEHIGTFTFWKYVFMFLFVSSLESLLTVKAVDNLDPYKRASDYNGDLIAQGSGNVLSGLLGGLPMISEVVRSSANVGFGAKTKWSNFFHGGFLLIAMLFMIPVIEMIPNAALAAMLIFAGFRLAAPKEFIHTYKVGLEQLVIFIVTIIVTMLEDLLLGVACGILVKFIFHLANGVPLKSLFKAHYKKEVYGNDIKLVISESAIFSNLLGFKRMLVGLPENANIHVDMSKVKLIDHSFMAFISHFQREYNFRGGSFEITGLENHKSFSDHPLSTKKLIKS
ncbi:MAG: sulfate transporter [Crocinitomicaceae bacterium]|jgi:MFS superfamily sulfate permease-like transporter|nr:sulfate transporter [Crocinitomicaceae bacterium]